MITGKGTNDSPYRLSADFGEGSANDLLNSRHSGEYIKFSDSSAKYRIVAIENNTTKIVSMDYANSGNSKNIGLNYTYGVSTNTEYWDYYLNTTWYNSLSFKNKLVSGTYYLGLDISNVRLGYKSAICSSITNEPISTCEKQTPWIPSNSYNNGNAYVGLLRMGEMFATQQGTGYSSSTTMWLITRDSDDGYGHRYVFRVNSYGNVSIWMESLAAVRPTYNLASTVQIRSGSGTELDPYEVEVDNE